MRNWSQLRHSTLVTILFMFKYLKSNDYKRVKLLLCFFINVSAIFYVDLEAKYQDCSLQELMFIHKVQGLPWPIMRTLLLTCLIDSSLVDGLSLELKLLLMLSPKSWIKPNNALFWDENLITFRLQTKFCSMLSTRGFLNKILLPQMLKLWSRQLPSLVIESEL